MSDDLKPNAKYDHVFAIVRIDKFLEAFPDEHKITVTKILHDIDDADEEVMRLNELHPDGQVRYFVKISRLERKEHEPA